VEVESVDFEQVTKAWLRLTTGVTATLTLESALADPHALWPGASPPAPILPSTFDANNPALYHGQ